jgi:hypothetical protein
MIAKHLTHLTIGTSPMIALGNLLPRQFEALYREEVPHASRTNLGYGVDKDAFRKWALGLLPNFTIIKDRRQSRILPLTLYAAYC